MGFLQQLLAGLGGGTAQPPMIGSPDNYNVPTQMEAYGQQQMARQNGTDQMRRFLAGLAAGAGSAQPGLSPGMAFVRGLGGGASGSMSYEERMRKEREDREQRAFQQRLQTLGLGLQQRSADRADQTLEETMRANRARENALSERNRLAAGRGGTGQSQSLRDEDALRLDYQNAYLRHFGGPNATASTHPDLWTKAQEYAETVIQQRRQRLGAGQQTNTPFVPPASDAEELE